MNRTEIKTGQLWIRNSNHKSVAKIDKVMTRTVRYQVGTEIRGCNKAFLREHFTLST